MRRLLLWPLLLAVSCAPVGVAGTETYYGFSIGIKSAPPPPRFVFVSPPPEIVVPGSYVYVVENDQCDMFRYGATWYAYYDGYWYRSNRYDATYVAVDVRSVPRSVLTVPEGNWKQRPLRWGHRGA